MRRWCLVRICTAWWLILLAVPAHAQLRAELIVEGLSAPVAFVPDPTSLNRFFIVEQGGLIRILDHGVLLSAPLLDLRPPAILAGGEQGLLGLAFAPDAATSGRFFVNFTSRAGHIVVARFQRVPATALSVDPATRFDLTWPGGTPYIPHPVYANHNGGHLAFGPDGYLYVGTGDGGSANDPDNHAQSAASLLGKMLRIDVNVPDGHATGYEIPPDNPFVDGAPIPALGEIWAFGLRNPWRYSFDDLGPGATGALIIGDVGQGAREEVDYEPAAAGGRNYGWRLREGGIATPGVPATSPAFLPLSGPLFDYERAIGRAVTGGFVYRGSALPAVYRGRYFVADFVTSRVGSLGLAVDSTTGEAEVTDVADHTAELSAAGGLGGVASFGRDRQGELYLVTFAGRVWKIAPQFAVEAPRALEAFIDADTVALRWRAPAGLEPSGYRLEAGSGPGLADVATLSAGPATRMTVAHVPDGTYFVRVRGERVGGAGAPSNEVRVVVTRNCAAAPDPPGGLTWSVAGGVVSLDWTASASASTYLVEAGLSPGRRDLVLPVGAATSLVVGAPGGRYFVRVRGVNPCGESDASDEVTVMVP